MSGEEPGRADVLRGRFLPPVAAPGPPVAPAPGPQAEPAPEPAPARRASGPRSAAPLVAAPWGTRAAAAIIDALVVGVGAAIILTAAAPALVTRIEADTASLAELLLTLLVVSGVALVYAPAIMTRTNGQTLGKLALGIRVVRLDGRPMTFLWAAMREVLVKSLGLGVIASVTFGVITFADYLWPLWDPERRALHDHVARTRVVRA